MQVSNQSLWCQAVGIARRGLAAGVVVQAAMTLFAVGGGPAAAQTALTDDGVRALLNERIERERRAVGMAAILVHGEQVRIVTAGSTSLDASAPVSADTLFEVGSISKTFTALLLADMVNRGEVALDDPVEKFLPQAAGALTLRDYTGAPIRLVDLATHRSGLPRLPDNMPSGAQSDPYADYRESDLLRYLQRRAVLIEKDGGATRRKRDERYEYSNLGFGLLGYVLGRAAGTTYADLLQRRVLTPLALTATWLVVPGAEQKRYSDGHVPDGTDELVDSYLRPQDASARAVTDAIAATLPAAPTPDSATASTTGTDA